MYAPDTPLASRTADPGYSWAWQGGPLCQWI